MALNKVRVLDKEQLLKAMMENGYEDIAKVFTERNITGRTFLDLSRFEMISWGLSPLTINKIINFINQVKANPYTLISLPREDNMIQTKSRETGVKHKFPMPLSTDLIGPHSKYSQPPPRRSKPYHVANKKPVMSLPTEQNISNVPPAINRKPVMPPRKTNTSVISFNSNLFSSRSNKEPIPLPVKEKETALPRAHLPLPVSISNKHNKSLNDLNEEHVDYEDIYEHVDEKTKDKNADTVDYLNLQVTGQQEIQMKKQFGLPSIIQTREAPDLIRDNQSKGAKYYLGAPGKPVYSYENYAVKNQAPVMQRNIPKFYMNRPLPPIPVDGQSSQRPSTSSMDLASVPVINVDGSDAYDIFSQNKLINTDDDGPIYENLPVRNIKNEEIANFSSEPFYRNVDRKEAKELLKNLSNGAFLFRPSQMYFLTLTVKYNGVFYNFGIEQRKNNTICLNADASSASKVPEFKTLSSFADYFTKEALTFEENGVLLEMYLNPDEDLKMMEEFNFNIKHENNETTTKPKASPTTPLQDEITFKPASYGEEEYGSSIYENYDGSFESLREFNVQENALPRNMIKNEFTHDQSIYGNLDELSQTELFAGDVKKLSPSKNHDHGYLHELTDDNNEASSISKIQKSLPNPKPFPSEQLLTKKITNTINTEEKTVKDKNKSTSNTPFRQELASSISKIQKSLISPKPFSLEELTKKINEVNTTEQKTTLKISPSNTPFRQELSTIISNISSRSVSGSSTPDSSTFRKGPEVIVKETPTSLSDDLETNFNESLMEDNQSFEYVHSVQMSEDYSNEPIYENIDELYLINNNAEELFVRHNNVQLFENDEEHLDNLMVDELDLLNYYEENKITTSTKSPSTTTFSDELAFKLSEALKAREKELKDKHTDSNTSKTLTADPNYHETTSAGRDSEFDSPIYGNYGRHFEYDPSLRNINVDDNTPRHNLDPIEMQGDQLIYGNIGEIDQRESPAEDVNEGSSDEQENEYTSELIYNVNSERFYRNTDRKGSKQLLQNLPDGAFLFRPSKKYNLVLTIKHKNQLFNLGIDQTANRTFRLNADMSSVSPEFRTLKSFVEHFTNDPLTFLDKGALVEIYLRPVLPDDLF